MDQWTQTSRLVPLAQELVQLYLEGDVFRAVHEVLAEACEAMEEADESAFALIPSVSACLRVIRLVCGCEDLLREEPGRLRLRAALRQLGAGAAGRCAGGDDVGRDFEALFSLLEGVVADNEDGVRIGVALAADVVHTMRELVTAADILEAGWREPV